MNSKVNSSCRWLQSHELHAELNVMSVVLLLFHYSAWRIYGVTLPDFKVDNLVCRTSTLYIQLAPETSAALALCSARQAGVNAV